MRVLPSRLGTRLLSRSSAQAWVLRLMAVLIIATLLVSSIVGGLLRAGVAVPIPVDSIWPGQAMLAHAFLMMCGFIGTVIGLERAVALKARYALLAPAASAAAGLLMLNGLPAAAAVLAVVASAVFVAANFDLVSRQPAPHTALLLAGALAWLIGNLLQAVGARPAAVLPWWFSFLVLTIAAERLEMTRLMRRRPGAAAALYGCVAALLLGSATFALSPLWGGLLYGLALAALAAWLVVFDIARRTLHAQGLSRYMAVCLLLGYGWLAVSGLAWMAAAVGWPTRDLALHALGLGFVVSMMFAHGPVILPALARIKLRFSGFFYLPLAMLHVSLIVRLIFGAFDTSLKSWGAICNAAAIAAFAATVIGSAVAWRLQNPAPSAPHHANPAPH